MDVPGVTGGADDAMAWAQAEEQQEKLLEELKKEVKAELKDVGVLRKEAQITVPAKVIADHMEHNYSELMHDAQVPGFRKGRAPRRLVEKRFGADVRESLTTSIVGQSFFAAVENAEIETLGDPRFHITTDTGVQLMEFDEALQHLKLPETGDFSYTCEVEIKPTFDLPKLKGIKIKAPEIKITDDMIDEQILRQRKNRGRFEPVDGAAETDDQVIADIMLTVDGEEIRKEENESVGVRPTQIGGIPVTDLGEVLSGKKVGDTCTAKCKIPPDFERADLRGKDGEFELDVHEIKRLAPEPMENFLAGFGFDNEKEAREETAAQMEAQLDQYTDRAKKAQVEQYLLENTKLDLPEEFSGRQTDRAVLRKVVELQQMGMPISDVEARIDELRTSASEEVANELRLGFILEKVAEELGVNVNDEEVNTEIARMAQLYNRRFDRVRDDLQSRGLLKQLVEQIRHNKCIAQLLTDAEIDTTPEKKSASKAKTAKKKTAKKTVKKKTTKKD